MLWSMEKNYFGQPTKNDIKIYDKIKKTATGQGDYCTVVCLLD